MVLYGMGKLWNSWTSLLIYTVVQVSLEIIGVCGCISGGAQWECRFSSHLLAKSGQTGKMFLSRGPQSFWHQRPVPWKSSFPWMGVGGIVQAVTWEMGSHGKLLMKLRWLTHRSPPAVRPSSPNRGQEPRFLRTVKLSGHIIHSNFGQHIYAV